MLQYFAIYKPYMTICQFTPENYNDITLADLGFEFPKDCYSVGRLDKDSEGLLLITNDNQLKTKILDPKFEHQKTYLVQVEGLPDMSAIEQLEMGVNININGKTHKTLPAKARLLDDEPNIRERNPPIRHRANIPTSWLKISITEGKNRQIRRMCAAVGFPVLRLVRFSMGNLSLQDIGNQNVKSFDKKTMYLKLGM